MTTKEYIFYRIVCKNPNITDCYVGSTTQFRNRKYNHKRSCNNISDTLHYYLYVYQFIRDNGGFENWDMIEIERLNLETKQESLKRERYWFEYYNASLNIRIPSRTKKEHYEDNSETINERVKLYRNENNEHCKELRKLHREKNAVKISEIKKQLTECKCGSVYRYDDKARHEQTKKHQAFIQNNNTPYYI